MRPPSPNGLYWSVHGEVACAEHAPETADPRWISEQWSEIPESAGHVTGWRFQCQHCLARGSTRKRTD